MKAETKTRCECGSRLFLRGLRSFIWNTVLKEGLTEKNRAALEAACNPDPGGQVEAFDRLVEINKKNRAEAVADEQADS